MLDSQLHKRIKWFAIIEIVLAIVLIGREIFHYLNLPSLSDTGISSVVDYFKYKENVYSPLFVLLIVLFSGIRLLQLRKSGWILNESVLTMVFICGLYPFILLFIPVRLWKILLIAGLTIGYFIFMKVLFKKQLLETFKIKKNDKVYGVVIGVGLSVIYWIIKLYLER